MKYLSLVSVQNIWSGTPAHEEEGALFSSISLAGPNLRTSIQHGTNYTVYVKIQLFHRLTGA